MTRGRLQKLARPRNRPESVEGEYAGSERQRLDGSEKRVGKFLTGLLIRRFVGGKPIANFVA